MTSPAAAAPGFAALAGMCPRWPDFWWLSGWPPSSCCPRWDICCGSTRPRHGRAGEPLEDGASDALWPRLSTCSRAAHQVSSRRRFPRPKDFADAMTPVTRGAVTESIARGPTPDAPTQPRYGLISTPTSTRCACSRSDRTWTGSSPAGNAKCFRNCCRSTKPASVPL